jgi:N-acetylglucosamine kinase-like BadF-type ATPase
VSALLAVDGGQSGLRMAVVDGDRLAERAEVAGFSHGAGEGILGVAAAVAEARRALSLTVPVRRICLGLTGAPRPRELKDRLGALISEELDGAEVWLGPDMVTAHAGALRGDAGVVVAAGTGAVVFAMGADGTAHRGDGLGFLLGDDGSGFAIGRAGIRAALRAREGRGPATALQDAATSFFGDLDELPHRVYTSANPVRELATFTHEVARAARAGDEVAAAIWREAVAGLVGSTAAVLRRAFPEAAAGSVPVSHTGRLFEVEDLLLEPFKAALAQRCTEARYRDPSGDSLMGAARLVQRGLGRYAALMHTTEGSGT